MPAWARNPAGFAAWALTFSGPAGEGADIVPPNVESSVTIGDWPGSSDLVDPGVAGGEAADEIKEEESCPPGGGDNCDKVRKMCRQKCSDKWADLVIGGIPIGMDAFSWQRKCKAACTAALGCGMDGF